MNFGIINMNKLRCQTFCGITATLPMCIDPLRSLRAEPVVRKAWLFQGKQHLSVCSLEPPNKVSVLT